jgi:hypothetical protein
VLRDDDGGDIGHAEGTNEDELRRDGQWLAERDARSQAE